MPHVQVPIHWQEETGILEIPLGRKYIFVSLNSISTGQTWKQPQGWWFQFPPEWPRGAKRLPKFKTKLLAITPRPLVRTFMLANTGGMDVWSIVKIRLQVVARYSLKFPRSECMDVVALHTSWTATTTGQVLLCCCGLRIKTPPKYANFLGIIAYYYLCAIKLQGTYLMPVPIRY